MNQFKPLVVALWVSAGLLTGCQSTMAPTTQVEPTNALSVLRTHAGSDAAMPKPAEWIVNSQDELEAIGSGPLGQISVDFDNETVVVIALGEQPTAGYWVTFISASQHGSTLYVQGTANQPGPDQVVAQVMTYPYAAAVIPKIDATVLIPEIDSVIGH